jgi:predicted Zn finger-like uncharacterized protein
METEIGDLGSKAAGASDSNVMILTCPECATAYFVDDARVAPGGRTVKCSNCGARWTARPPGEPSSAPAPAKPAPKPPPPPTPAVVDEVVFEAPAPPEPAALKQKAAHRKRGGGGAVAVWIGAAVAAAALIGAAIVFRVQVVQMLPASAAAYAGLGMPVSSLVIEKVKAQAAFEGGRPVLQVSGQLRNERDTTATAPALRINLLDWTGKVVAAKIARPMDAPVPGKAVRYFAVTLPDPPLSAHDLDLTFEPAHGQATAPAVRATIPSTSPSPPADGPAAAPASK